MKPMNNNIGSDSPMTGYVKPKLSFVRVIFYLLLVVLGVFIYLNLTEFKDFLLYLRNINLLWFVLALIAQVLTYFIVAELFANLLKRFGCKGYVSRRELFKVAIVSFFLTNVIPSGGLSGQGYLVYFFQRKNLPKNNSFLLAVLETLTYYFAHFIFAIFLVFYLFFSKIKLGGVLFTVGFFGIALFLFLDVVVLSLTSKKIMVFFEKRSQHNRFIRYFWKKLNLVEEEFSHEEWESPFEFIKNEKHYLFLPLIFQMLIFFADALTIWFLFYGFGFSVNFLTILAGFVLTKIVAMASFSPGGLVFFEGAMVLFYSSFSIPSQLVLIVTLMFRVLSFWLPLPIGLIFYRHLRINSQNNQKLVQPNQHVEL